MYLRNGKFLMRKTILARASGKGAYNVLQNENRVCIIKVT